MKTASGAITKAETLSTWRKLPADAPILPHMTVIPYRSEGSKYGACGIRIDGNPQFVDAVLGRLKDLLTGESNTTRLELARRGVVTGFKATPNADEDAQVCYIRLHQRGHVAAAMNTAFGLLD